MLHPLYALRARGHTAEYNAQQVERLVRSFLLALPDGEDEYLEGVRRMCTYLYGRALEGSGRRYFLDKTPRYYFVLPELCRTFPNAHYIILFRNPLAVMCSMLKHWVGIHGLYKFSKDLLEAPRFLVEGVAVAGERGLVVQYEQLVANPEREITRICDGLGIGFVPEMIEYGRGELPHWSVGDQQEVYKHTRPVLQNVDRWIQSLEHPQVWRLTRDYLRLLGPELVEQMGYSYENLQQVLEVQRPRRRRLWFTLSMTQMMETPVGGRKPWNIGLARLWAVLHRRGLLGTMSTAWRRLIRGQRRS